MVPLITFPGKIGDAFLQWPVARWFIDNKYPKVDIAVAEQISSVGPIFERQPGVNSVVYLTGIHSWHLGGQPWDFGMQSVFGKWTVLIHLGFRERPDQPITLHCAKEAGANLDKAPLSDPALILPQDDKRNRLLLHGTFKDHQGHTPSFWSVIRDNRELLEKAFDEIYFIGASNDLSVLSGLDFPAKPFFDDGDIIKTAEFMANSKLVIGCGSSMVALAGALGIPSLRLHDPTGLEQPVFSHVGANQVNIDPRELQVTEIKEIIELMINKEYA